MKNLDQGESGQEHRAVPSSESQATPELSAAPLGFKLPLQMDVDSYANDIVIHDQRWARVAAYPKTPLGEAKAKQILTSVNTHDALVDELVRARDTFSDLARNLRMLRHGVAASACDIARDSLNETIALATKPDTSELKGA